MSRIGQGIGLLLVAAAVLGLFGMLVALLLSGKLAAEVFIGLIIVLAIGFLLIVLSVMTVVFAQIKLADPKQALGLPEGSIRALIALILLMVFIIVGIYLFREVSNGATILLRGLSSEEINELGAAVVYQRETPAGSGTFDVWVRNMTDDGTRLAQQLITTIGTLVVAVAGFYFGTSTVTAARGVTTSSPPVIRSIDPDAGTQGEERTVKISGKNLKSPRSVRLVHGSSEIAGTAILSADVGIQARFQIPSDASPDEKWDLVVQNEDGQEDRLPEAFMVNATAIGTKQ